MSVQFIFKGVNECDAKASKDLRVIEEIDVTYDDIYDWKKIVYVFADGEKMDFSEKNVNRAVEIDITEQILFLKNNKCKEPMKIILNGKYVGVDEFLKIMGWQCGV